MPGRASQSFSWVEFRGKENYLEASLSSLKNYQVFVSPLMNQIQQRPVLYNLGSSGHGLSRRQQTKFREDIFDLESEMREFSKHD